MGSGETTPTMAKVHRHLFDRLGPDLARAVIVDTPYGFQSNAADISARAVAYFRESTGHRVEVASLARAEGAGLLVLESAQAAVAEAQWVFSGPGSPTYAMRQWRQTQLPRLLADKLVSGGCVVFSSAAALTLGRWTVPVYEIYKAGADPVWEEGLDLLGPIGLDVAVIPHYDNAEGGTHDTRYCYLGEGRLRVMEAELPAEAWVLGVDEHTACIFDLSAGTFTVMGLGAVTVRRQGESARLSAGLTMGIQELLTLAAGIPSGPSAGATALADDPSSGGAPGLADAQGLADDRSPGGASGAAIVGTGARYGLAPGPAATAAASPFILETRRLTAAFDEALAHRDPQAATEAALELEDSLHAWSADTFESDELDRARANLRRTVLRLGEAAGPGLRDPRAVVEPWVTALLIERDEARRSRRFADADRIRDSLEAAGVEVRDTPAGTEWSLRASSHGASPPAGPLAGT
jgi:cyanophycinase-like exopeptidase